MHTGFIYKIVADGTDKVYYGSTIQKLNVRFSRHKHDSIYRLDCRSKELFNYENTRIELIDTCVDDNRASLKKQMEEIEAECIIRCRKIKPDTCVNYKVPRQTKTQYRIDNRDKYKLWVKNNSDKHDKYNENRRLKAKLIREQNALIDSSSQTAVETI